MFGSGPLQDVLKTVMLGCKVVIVEKALLSSLSFGPFQGPYQYFSLEFFPAIGHNFPIYKGRGRRECIHEFSGTGY